MHSPDDQQTPSTSARYSLSVDEAVLRFSEAGVPRSPRSIRRYCERGHLDATLADGIQGERYLIDPASIDRRIEELRQQEVVSRRDRKEPDTTGTDQPGLAKAGPDRAASKDIQELEAKILDLRITNRAKDYALEQFKKERDSLIEQVATKSHRIGQLETRLEIQAGVPPEQLTVHADTRPNTSKKTLREPPGPPSADQEAPRAPHEHRAPAES